MKNLTKSLLIGGALCSTVAYARQEPKKLNVLYIMTDQQNYNMMSCMIGNEYISTPNMDRIAAEGYNFVNTYCANPVSMPSRFSLSTGMPASSVNTKGNTQSSIDKEKLALYTKNALGNLFNRAGYETVYSGKTHLYGKLDAYGYTDVRTQDPYDKGCQEAVKYLDSRKKSADNKPFFMFVSFMNPHDICYSAGLDPRFPDHLKGSQAEATKKYLEIKANMSPEEYQRQIPPRMPNEEFMIADPNDPDMPDPARLKSSGADYRTWTEEEQNTFRWMYCRLTESVDELIGQVLDALERSGEKENTIIVFTSDHGELLGAHGYRTKSLLFAEAQRIPFMFAGPGIKKGVMDEETLTCNGYDLLPTLCDFVGIEAPDYLPGISLKPALTGNKKKLEKREYIVTECSNAYQITDGVNKLTLHEFDGYPRTFTNLEEDPYEKVNMLKDARYANVIKEMQAELDRVLKERGTKLKIKNVTSTNGSKSNSANNTVMHPLMSKAEAKAAAKKN